MERKERMSRMQITRLVSSSGLGLMTFLGTAVDKRQCLPLRKLRGGGRQQVSNTTYKLN